MENVQEEYSCSVRKVEHQAAIKSSAKPLPVETVFKTGGHVPVYGCNLVLFPINCSINMQLIIL